MQRSLPVITLLFFIVLNINAQYTYPFQDPDKPIEERIDNLLSLLTPYEKLSWMDQHQPAISRLDIDYFTTWTEGLHGLAWAQMGTVTATQFPQAKGLSNTWSTEIMKKVGFVEGYEARVFFKKYNGNGIGLVLRAPMVDMGRDIRWGRTEESYGEDPFLVSTMGKGMVKGLQGDHPGYLMAASTLKHFLANNNEANRDVTSSNFDERNLHEYYLVPFRECLMGQNARSFMTAYNLINGIPATVTPLVRDIVINDWGYNGMICTDAYAFYNLTGSQNYYASPVTAAAEVVLAGTNVFVDYDKNALSSAYTGGLITEDDIDRVIRGNVRLRFQLGLFDPPERVPFDTVSANSDPWFGNAHKDIALEAAEKSIVLLKNEQGILPLHIDSIRSIAVIGPNAGDVFRDWYGGYPPYKVSVLKGIQNRVGDSVTVVYGANNNNNIADTSDLAIVCVGNHPTCGNNNWADCSSDYQGRETHDRKYIELEPSHLNIVKEVYAANPNTVVVLVSSFPQAIKWIQDSVPGIMHITHSCQELGNAVARALFGDVNPGGKTVFTWPAATSDLPDFMDYNIRNNRTYMYYEGDPLYPFGYGLSYSDFSFSGITISVKSLTKDDTLKVRFDLGNTGPFQGDEVVQLYVNYLNSSVERPHKELKAFDRVSLSKDMNRLIEFSVPVKQLSYWNETEQSFYVEETDIEIQVGNSSTNILLRDTITISGGGKVRLVPEPEVPSALAKHFNLPDCRILYDQAQPVLEIILTRPAELELSVYDLKGIIYDAISSKNLPEGTYRFKLNNNISVSGMYIVSGRINQGFINEKFIIR